MNGKNRIIQLLRQRPQSRVELAAATGLVKSSLTKITRQLLQEQLIEQVSEDESTAGGRGRPHQLLRLRKQVNFSLCCYVSVDGMISYLIDQTGDVVAREQQSWTVRTVTDAWHVDAFLSLLAATATRLCQPYISSCAELKTVTLATQGKIAQVTGVIHYSQLFKERHIHLAELITTRLGVPAQIVNIAYCSSFYLTQTRPAESFVAILMGYGLGVGISVDGQLVMGPHGTAPEISHMTYANDGPACYCGARGCAETYLTYHSLLAAIAELDGKPVPGSSINEQLHYVYQHALNGHAGYEAVIRERGRVLAFVLSQLTTLLDLHRVIINGEMSLFFHFFQQEIANELPQHSDYSFGDNQLAVICEEDNDIAFKGLVALTNESYHV